MSKKDYSSLGNQLRDSIQDAIRTQDFTKFNEQLQDTIGSALDEVKKQTGGHPETAAMDFAKRASKTVVQTGKAVASAVKENVNTRRPLYPATLVTRKPKGKVSQILGTVFGSLGMTGTACVGAAALITLAAGGFSIAVSVLTTITVCIGAGSAALLAVGSSSRRRVNRFYRYCSLLQGRTYCYIKDMAAAIGRTPSYVVKDLQKMIEYKMFPQGHFDTEYTMFILSNDTYNQYLISKKAQDERAALLASETEHDRVFRETVELGEQYLRKISDANDRIPGEEISEKLFRLEATVRKIFDHVKNHPDQIPELRRFMNYYLPTTLKLVETYCELQLHPTAGPNVSKTMSDIETSLDTINEAFDRLFDSLFESTAMDVSTDISVLNTMLAKEGLTHGAFSKEPDSKIELK